MMCRELANAYKLGRTDGCALSDKGLRALLHSRLRDITGKPYLAHNQLPH